MRELIWRAVARIVTIPAVTDWLIERARRTPYTNITSSDGTDIYMVRLWLFNAYGKDAKGDPAPARFSWLPSARIHHIRRPDADRHQHSHPWDARTIILRGWYWEELPDVKRRLRLERQTGRLLHTDYHRIDRVPSQGVWTLFLTWKKRDSWYFNVDGVKVPWRKYLGLENT